jgi:hypothetical protein
MGGSILAFGVAVLCVESLRSEFGWFSALVGVSFLLDWLTYDPRHDVGYTASASRLVTVLAICVLPPLILLLTFGNHPEWLGPLTWLFLTSITFGPVLLLRRYRCRPKPSNDQSRNA